MDGARFDAWARTLARSSLGNRRRLVAGAASAVLAAIIGADGRAGDHRDGGDASGADSNGRPPCRGRGARCDRDAHCCFGNCDPKRGRCFGCRKGMKPCGRRCIPSTACCGDADCAGDQVCCGTVCVSSTVENCGTCGKRCPRGHLCCDGSCVPSDEGNCGTCGERCPSGRLCCGGECIRSGWSACGACGNQCRGDQVCQTFPGPARCCGIGTQPCQSDADCCSDRTCNGSGTC